MQKTKRLQYSSLRQNFERLQKKLQGEEQTLHTLENKTYDVLIIGGGVVGSAAARELSKYKLSILVLEKEPDVCCETSARNSGVLHAGFNNKPGSLMAKFCVEGNRGFDKLAAELDIPYKRTGKLIVGFTEDDRERLHAMKETGDKNGVPGLELVGKDRIQAIAPKVGGEFAMWSPSTAILDPFQYTVGLAENAVKNGAAYLFCKKVTGIRWENGQYTVTAEDSEWEKPESEAQKEKLHTEKAAQAETKEYHARWIINCAGLSSAHISDMLGIHGYEIHPCRGEYFILDKCLGPLLPVPAYPVPNPKEGGLGIHLTPTIDGNLLVGPSAEYIENDSDYAVTQHTMDLLLKDGARIFPYLKREYFIRNFAGIRPKLTSKEQGGYHDFVIEHRPEAPHAVNLVGIESPGLTSAIPIAHEIIRLMQEEEKLLPNPQFDPYRKRRRPFRELSKEEQAARIRENPDEGEIICRCETVTKAEILDAIHNPLGVHTMTGIKYRCRSMMGRCQGGYCQTRIAELLQKERQERKEDVRYCREDGWMFTGALRTKCAKAEGEAHKA